MFIYINNEIYWLGNTVQCSAKEIPRFLPPPCASFRVRRMVTRIVLSATEPAPTVDSPRQLWTVPANCGQSPPTVDSPRQLWTVPANCGQSPPTVDSPRSGPQDGRNQFRFSSVVNTVTSNSYITTPAFSQPRTTLKYHLSPTFVEFSLLPRA